MRSHPRRPCREAAPMMLPSQPKKCKCGGKIRPHSQGRPAARQAAADRQAGGNQRVVVAARAMRPRGAGKRPLVMAPPGGIDCGRRRRSLRERRFRLASSRRFRRGDSSALAPATRSSGLHFPSNRRGSRSIGRASGTHRAAGRHCMDSSSQCGGGGDVSAHGTIATKPLRLRRRDGGRRLPHAGSN